MTLKVNLIDVTLSFPYLEESLQRRIQLYWRKME